MAKLTDEERTAMLAVGDAANVLSEAMNNARKLGIKIDLREIEITTMGDEYAQTTFVPSFSIRIGGGRGIVG